MELPNKIQLVKQLDSSTSRMFEQNRYKGPGVVWFHLGSPRMF